MPVWGHDSWQINRPAHHHHCCKSLHCMHAAAAATLCSAVRVIRISSSPVLASNKDESNLGLLLCKTFKKIMKKKKMIDVSFLVVFFFCPVSPPQSQRGN